MHDYLHLFVYGSLKVGECNDHYVTRWLVDWTEATTLGELRLRSDGYPALYLREFGPLGSADYAGDLSLSGAARPTAGRPVKGQLLRLHSGVAALQTLDRFEGYFPQQTSEYLRVGLTVDTPRGPQACWTYTGVGIANPSWEPIQEWPPPGHIMKPEPYHHGLS